MAKLLLVEDHPINRKLFVDILSLDHEVVAAPSAEDALELLVGFTPALILMDIQLPGMDGIALTRKLKEQSGLRRSADRGAVGPRDARGNRAGAARGLHRLHHEADHRRSLDAC